MAGFLEAVVSGGRFAGWIAGHTASMVLGSLRDAVRSEEELLAERHALRAELAALERQIEDAAPEAADPK